jgi:fructokinase
MIDAATLLTYAAVVLGLFLIPGPAVLPVPARAADGQACFAPKPGGAPGNVAVGVAKLGGRAAMLSKVGQEAFGRMLIETLVGYGVATEGVVMNRDGNTALAVVTVAPDGDRDFMFYRVGCADATYAAAEVAEDIIRAARVLHVGSLILAEPVSAAAQRHAVEVARAAGVMVSADVNLRPSLWRDPDDMRAAALEAVSVANILKISEEELSFLTGAEDRAAGVAKLWQPALRAMAVTCGGAGAQLVTPRHRATVPGFAVKVVDAVGCGDAFMACLLADLSRSDFALASEAELARLARRACAAGAIAAMGAGAMESLPTGARLEAFLAERE